MNRKSSEPCIKCHEGTRLNNSSYCRKCASDYERERRNRFKDEINARRRESYSPSKRRKQLFFYKYGLTEEQYDSMLDSQGGMCAICKQDKPLHVDHDHNCCPSTASCGKCIRGLLCNNCNNGLGRFGDNVDALRAAISYLEKDAHE